MSPVRTFVNHTGKQDFWLFSASQSEVLFPDHVNVSPFPPWQVWVVLDNCRSLWLIVSHKALPSIRQGTLLILILVLTPTHDVNISIINVSNAAQNFRLSLAVPGTKVLALAGAALLYTSIYQLDCITHLPLTLHILGYRFMTIISYTISPK